MTPEAERAVSGGGSALAAAEVADDAWDDPPRRPRRDRDALHLDLAGYEGPLDLLLDLVRAGRVDVSAISILDLADQFAVAVEGATARGDVPLSRLGDWLVAAANLALLRSRLLLPEDSREGREARREAEHLRRKLADRDAIRALADWLTRRHQLGRDVFERGAPAEAQDEDVVGGRGSTSSADLTTLLRVSLELMVRPERGTAYRPTPPDLWRTPAALARMRRLLGEWDDAAADGTPLSAFLPPAAYTPTAVQRRAALASTLVAGLEMARDGEVTLRQRDAFGPVLVGRAEEATPRESVAA